MRIRIISGIFKGRMINVPQSKLIRPTTDRLRETLFNILNNKIDFDGIVILDLYSGSGSFGLECISRGAKQATFVEKNFQIYKNLIENIKSLDVEALCEIEKSDVLDFSKRLPVKQYDLIYADPPYIEDDVYDVVTNLKVNNFLKADGSIIIERSKKTKERDIFNFAVNPFRIIGDTCLYKIT